MEPAVSVTSCRALAVLALATGLSSCVPASPYTDAAETAVFDLCPALRDGRISGHHPAALTRHGYRRRVELEEDEGDAEDGAPFIFIRGTGAEEIVIHYWGYPDRCEVSFSVEQGADALAHVRERLARESRRYRPVPSARWTSRDGWRRSWLVSGPVPMCLDLGGGYFDGQPTGYGVSYEPYPVLHPGMANSSCDPYRGPV